MRRVPRRLQKEKGCSMLKPIQSPGKSGLSAQKTIGSAFFAALALAISVPVYAAPADQAASHGGHEVVLEAEGLGEPWGLAAGGDGGIYVVNALGSILQYKDGKTKTVAGIGEEGFGDGPADKAAFRYPTFAAVNSVGNLLVADTDNHVIRRLEDGEVYTTAGSGAAGYRNGLFNEARLHAPSGIAVDKEGNVYVADTLNHVIRRIGKDGTVSNFAGAASEEGGFMNGLAEFARFNEPTGLALDAKGGLFVADTGNNVIRYIYNGRVSTYAGKLTPADDFTGYLEGGYRNGPAKQALFNRPRGLAYADGVLFVADSLNYRIRAVQPDGEVITLAGASVPGEEVGTGDEARFDQPSGLLYLDGKLYISDTLNGDLKSLTVEPGALAPVRSEEDILAEADLLPAGEQPQVWLNGHLVTFTDDAVPFRKDSDIFIPVRELFDAWGAEVRWNEAARSIEVSKGKWNATLLTTGNADIALRGGVSYAAAEYVEELTGFLMVIDNENNAVVVSSR